MKKQRTFKDAEWDALIKAHDEAPHGFKLKAEQRLKDFVNDQLRRETRPSKATQRNAA